MDDALLKGLHTDSKHRRLRGDPAPFIPVGENAASNAGQAFPPSSSSATRFTAASDPSACCVPVHADPNTEAGAQQDVATQMVRMLTSRP